MDVIYLLFAPQQYTIYTVLQQKGMGGMGRMGGMRGMVPRLTSLKLFFSFCLPLKKKTNPKKDNGKPTRKLT